ncbi:MAG: hypothetical protein KJ058_16990 [Thermoanaerobaculia bacterium]|nr:hypothetical protein [Thermoanaerobaculia bacterium]MCZ7650258.1 hypothetical protein [Thermoanaerobaculia bacterium]
MPAWTRWKPTHLASALALRAELATEARCVASNLTLPAAARRERLPVLDPTG